MSAKQYEGLNYISGFPFSVFTSAETESRALSIADRCQNAFAFLKSTFAFEPEVCVLVLSPQDWKQHATYPVYGMPHYADHSTLVVAGQGSDFWQSMSPPVEALPPDAARAMRNAYGQPDGSVNLSPFFDLLAVHELSHLFQFQAGSKFPRLWLAELFCNLSLHAYTVAVEPDQITALETFPQLVASLPISELRYRSLADFERLYIDVGPQNYGWYQCRFHVAARHIYENGGVESLRRLWREFLNSEENVSDEKLVLRLREVHPTVEQVLTTWPE